MPGTRVSTPCTCRAVPGRTGGAPRPSPPEGGNDQGAPPKLALFQQTHEKQAWTCLLVSSGRWCSRSASQPHLVLEEVHRAPGAATPVRVPTLPGHLTGPEGSDLPCPPAASRGGPGPSNARSDANPTPSTSNPPNLWIKHTSRLVQSTHPTPRAEHPPNLWIKHTSARRSAKVTCVDSEW